MLQLRTAERKIAPISQQLGDFFTWRLSALVNGWLRNYSARLGMTDFSGISPEKVSLNSPPAAPVAPARSQAAAYGVPATREVTG